MSSGRIVKLNTVEPVAEGAVVYAMHRDQRLRDNHALLAAQAYALGHELPLVIFFNALNGLSVRSREHFEFLYDGLEELVGQLADLNIGFTVVQGDPATAHAAMERSLKPAAVFFDFSPLNERRDHIKAFAGQSSAACYVVDTHNVIPAWIASDKEEFAAHTFRFKVHKHLGAYLQEPERLQKHPYGNAIIEADKLHITRGDVLARVSESGINVAAKPGEKAALTHLKTFIESRLENYAVQRNDIAEDKQSGLSPYLHLGQISSLRVALEVARAVNEEPFLLRYPKLAKPNGAGLASAKDGMNALLEEMIVRKELADNYCLYNPHYKELDGAKPWAVQTLQDRQNDVRDHLYSTEQWEQAQTHDLAWNAAQQQLLKTGKIHGYMRMYWAKKLLEWSESPAEAIKTAIYLNDKYSIDGVDPNGYVGIMWSIAGLHDRPWAERPVFGKIRYMNAEGLKRKFDLTSYLSTWG